MSSTHIVEPPETSGEKKDDTLIIVVNDDGTISVDQETLQNLIMNQSSANVSVVRVGQTDANVENGDITLTVDPPAFTPAVVTPAIPATTAAAITMNPANIATDPNTLVDPFMEMDPEQLERLETALQSEEAKQILGENVTAMLDMLTVEERQKSIRYSVELDHCYTSRSSPSDPKPKDPLPVINSPTSNEIEYLHHHPTPSQGSATASLGAQLTTGVNFKGKPTGKVISGKQMVRSRKPVALTPTGVNNNARAITTTMPPIKLSAQAVNRSATGSLQPVTAKVHGRTDQEEEEDATSSGESSGSEPPSDDDSDFGPRGPKGHLRSVNISTTGIRSRGGRKGLTTRGGTMAAARRGSRGANKQMDLEQVRRLDLEMAAAVNAMKSPTKDERCVGGQNYSPMRGKRQIRITPARKRDDLLPTPPAAPSSASASASASARAPTPTSAPAATPALAPAPERNETQHEFEKGLQTTNHVKASLISANMIKGDMILTKPGQAKSNQRVTFVQKQVAMKPNELKNIGVKKDTSLTKRKLLAQAGTKFFATKDGKLIELPTSSKSPALDLMPEQSKDSSATVTQQPEAQPLQQQAHLQEDTEMQIHMSTRVTCAGTSPKGKSLEIKKEKRRSESNSDCCFKVDGDTASKGIDSTTGKAIDSAKKHSRKEHRKSPGCVADALGPALFSTPDIIRRVGTNSDAKLLADNLSPPTGLCGSTALSSAVQPTIGTTVPTTSGSSQNESISSLVLQQSETHLLHCVQRGESITNTCTGQTSPQTESTMGPIAAAVATARDESDVAGRFPSTENDTEKPNGKSTNAAEELQLTPLGAGSIEGEEHLLATLEMEATKHEEELLAEALLLQEELGVDLGDHPELGDGSNSTPAELQSHSEPTLLTNTTTTSLEQQQLDHHHRQQQHHHHHHHHQQAALPSIEADISNMTTCLSVSSSPGISTSGTREAPAKRSVKENDKEPIRIVRGGRVITLPPIEAPATRSKKLQAKTDLSPAPVDVPKKPIDKLSSPTGQVKARATKEVQQQRVPVQYGHASICQEEQELEEEVEEETVAVAVGKNQRFDQHQATSSDQQQFRGGLQRLHGVHKVVNADQVCEGGDDEEEDEEDEEGENSDSEDDPDRLWCICKRPHNNRFMICCDVCEDWFHGKCVHVSKAMGQQMEEKGIEWVCPNCVKKKSEEAKSRTILSEGLGGKQRSREAEVTTDDGTTMNLPRSGTLSVRTGDTSSFGDGAVEASAELAVAVSCSGGGSMQCVVCKREARNSSIYCSDACILAHAQETLTKDKPASGGNMGGPRVAKTAAPSEPPSKVKVLEPRIIVFERKTGKLLTGFDAPTRSNLKSWLKDNPTFEVINAHNLSSTMQGRSSVSPAGKTHIPPKTLFGKLGGANKQAGTAATANKRVILMSSGSSPQALASVSPKTIPIKSITSVSISSSRSPITTTMKHGVGSKASTIAAGQGSKAAQLSAVGSSTSGGASNTVLISPKQLVGRKQQQPQQLQQDVKQQQSTPQQQAAKQPIKTSPTKRPEAEPIRVNIRKSLTDLLTTRIRATDDLKLTVEEIAELAINIEHELYKYFKDTGAKYKAKYRSLVFNIKDTKNLTLFRKIADRSLAPDAVVRLSPDEMASQELAEWREKETKHQLEMIKKNELDLMAQAKSIVVKTHKGEQIIENDGAIEHVDPKTPVQDIVAALNSGDSISSTVDDSDKERGGEKEGMEARDRDRDREKERDKPRTSSEDKANKRKEKEKGRSERGESRLKGTSRRERSTSRSRYRHSRERERSKSRERSKEAKSSTRSKESRREKEKNRERTDRKERCGGSGGDRSSKAHDKGRDRSRQKEKDRERERDKEKEKVVLRDKDKERERGHERSREKYNKGGSDDGGHLRNRGAIIEAKDSGERGGRREHERADDYGGSEARTDSSKPIEDRLWRHIEDETTTNTIDGNDSDVSDREPTSTVTIKTPDINEDSERFDRDQENKDTMLVAGPPSTTMGGRMGTLAGIIGSGLESGTAGGTGSASASGVISQTVWRGFVSMVDVAKFFITAQEISGNAKDLMEDLPDTVDVVGRISHDTVWDYISKMKRTGSKEILVIRLTAANDEEKIPYITLYSYLNSRSRLGVVGNVSKNIKDFYIMPFSKQSSIPPVLLPLMGPGLEEQRPHLLLGIIVRNRRKRLSAVPATIPMKVARKDTDRSYTPPLLAISGKDKSSISSLQSATTDQSLSHSVTVYQKAVAAAIDSVKEKQSITQTTLESLNKAHVGMSRSLIDSATISKIVPELSSKIDLTTSPTRTQLDDDDDDDDDAEEGDEELEDGDDGDEPYSPGQMDDEKPMSLDIDMRTTSASLTAQTLPTPMALQHSTDVTSGLTAIRPNKNSSDLQRKMDEINRQIEEQKQQIQSISSSFLGETSSTLPGLGLDPIESSNECEEAYSPSDVRSFTPPPPSSSSTTIPKLAQPLLEKVSNITIPPNLQEILANVKRQESSKVDPYLPLKPSATFLPAVNSSSYQNLEKYSNISSPSAANPVTSSTSISSSMSSCSSSSSPSSTPSSLSVGKASTPSSSSKSLAEGSLIENAQHTPREHSLVKESKSTLSSLSDLDLIRKAEEELAAVAAAASLSSSSPSAPTAAAVAAAALVSSGPSSPTTLPAPTNPQALLSLSQTVSLSTPLPSARSNAALQQPLAPLAATQNPTAPAPTTAATKLPTVLGSNLEQPAGPPPADSPAGASSCSRLGYPDPFKKTFAPEQPKPPGLEDEDFPPFPSTPPSIESSGTTSKPMSRSQKLTPKSGIILHVKRKLPEDGSCSVANKTPRTKSRWGQGPPDPLD